MTMLGDVVYGIFGVMIAIMMLLMLFVMIGWLGYTHYAGRSYRTFDMVFWLAVVATIVQLYHLLEHFRQLDAWFHDPTGQPWMSGLFMIADRGFALIAGRGSQPAVGMEIVHLIGNSIFFIGIVAWRRHFANKWVKWAYWLQGFHVIEHIGLTATMLAWSAPLGLSTLYGLAPHLGATVATSYRIWWHFTMNLAATSLLLAALAAQYRDHRLAVRAAEGMPA